MSSHPVCNTIMLAGVIACFVSVFLLGIDGRFVEPWEYPAVCQARSWMLCTGFTLAFGAMFSKVWRVHRLTTKTKADQAKVGSTRKTHHRLESVDIDLTINDVAGVSSFSRSIDPAWPADPARTTLNFNVFSILFSCSWLNKKFRPYRRIFSRGNCTRW